MWYKTVDHSIIMPRARIPSDVENMESIESNHVRGLPWSPLIVDIKLKLKSCLYEMNVIQRDFFNVEFSTLKQPLVTMLISG